MLRLNSGAAMLKRGTCALAMAVALSLCGLVADVYAEESPVIVKQAMATPPPPASNTQQLVCHMEKPLGSNIGKRICRTKEAIEEDAERAREAMQHVNQARNASDPAG